MTDLVNPEMERDNTIVLSGNLDACDMLDYMQVTLAKFESVNPAVTLYRFTDGEEVTSFELSGFELGKLVEVSAKKSASSVVSVVLERSKNRLQQASSSVCPDLVVSDVLVELVQAFSQVCCSEAQKAQVQAVLDAASEVIVQESRKQSA